MLHIDQVDTTVSTLALSRGMAVALPSRSATLSEARRAASRVIARSCGDGSRPITRSTR
jgi:hypothetical protein